MAQIATSNDHSLFPRPRTQFFLRLEAAGVMLRIDQDTRPTMAKMPTLASWELDLLRTVEHVVRLGHILRVDRHEILLEDGTIPLPPGYVVVHCAASGLQYPPLVPSGDTTRSGCR